MSDYIELNGWKYRVATEVADALIATTKRTKELEARIEINEKLHERNLDLRAENADACITLVQKERHIARLRAENERLRELHDIYEEFFSAWETGSGRELRDANDAMIAARAALEQER